MEKEDKKFSVDEVDEIVKNMQIIEINRKKEYWVNCGEVLFADEPYMIEKWKMFVEEFLLNHIDNSGVLDQILQIISMIKAGIPIDNIRMICDQIAYKKVVLDSLAMFVHPEYLDKLNDSKKRI